MTHISQGIMPTKASLDKKGLQDTTAKTAMYYCAFSQDQSKACQGAFNCYIILYFCVEFYSSSLDIIKKCITSLDIKTLFIKVKTDDILYVLLYFGQNIIRRSDIFFNCMDGLHTVYYCTIYFKISNKFLSNIRTTWFSKLLFLFEFS